MWTPLRERPEKEDCSQDMKKPKLFKKGDKVEILCKKFKIIRVRKNKLVLKLLPFQDVQ